MKDEHNKLTSRGLAVLIVDALIDAGLLQRTDAAAAVEAAAEEIEVRKSMGDYA